jgi:hypothetical protein
MQPQQHHPISVIVKMPVENENETVQRRLTFEDNMQNTNGNSFGTFSQHLSIVTVPIVASIN